MDFIPGANTSNVALQNQLATLMQSIEQLNRVKNTIPDTTVSRPTKAMEFVKGVAGARNYLKDMEKNTSAAVFDSDESVFYALSVDANGVPAPIKRCPFTMEDVPDETVNVVTKKDIDDIRADLQSLAASIKPLVQQSQQNGKGHNNNQNGRNEQ